MVDRYVWRRIRSWHAVIPSRAFVVTTLCGRYIAPNAGVSDDVPTSGKTCESCLRIMARRSGD
jgi:hypothetical protein